jgi:superfamily II DNA or RNA helicase
MTMAASRSEAAGVTLSLWQKAPYFFINGDLPDHVREQLDTELSYEVEGHEYTDSWKNGDWDGREYLLRQTEDGTWFFPIGLLERVRTVLDANGVDYTVEGLNRPGRGDMDFEWLADFDLREYQETAVDDALLAGSGVISMPTGAGKTVVGIRLMYELQRPTLVLVNNKEIADQWVESIKEYTGVDAARYYGGDRENGDVMVGLYQSIYMDGEIVDDVRLDHEVMICDEVHTVGADTFSEVALSVTAPYRYGLSATPERSDNAELKVYGGTGSMIADLSVERLIEQGYLAEPEWRLVEAPSSGTSYRQWQDEYKEEIVKNGRRNRRITSVVDEIDTPALVTVERIEHGERLEALIDGAAFVHGSASDRDDVVQSFRDGELPVMIATRGIVGEGFNVPEIESFVVGGGLRSEVSMIQQVGRALRPDTETATIVDFFDRGQWISDHSEQRIRTYQDYYKSHGPL